MSEKKQSSAGPIIAGTAISLIALSPFFGAAAQKIDNAMAPDTSNVTLSPADQLGMDGYTWLKSKGYGSLNANDDSVHITMLKANLNDPANASKGGTIIYNTTAPGTLNWEKVTVTFSPADPSKPLSAQNHKIVKIAPSSNSLDVYSNPNP